MDQNEPSSHQHQHHRRQWTCESHEYHKLLEPGSWTEIQMDSDICSWPDPGKSDGSFQEVARQAFKKKGNPGMRGMWQELKRALTSRVWPMHSCQWFNSSRIWFAVRVRFTNTSLILPESHTMAIGLFIFPHIPGYTTIFCWISPSFGLTCLADTSSLWRTKAARSTWPLRLFHAPKKPWLQAEDPTKSNRLELMVWQLVTT